MSEKRRIAYFSMEIGLDATIPTYSGGLGILAGDTIRAAADLNVPMVAVTLLHRKGYFFQRLEADGWQQESAVEWSIDDYLQEEKSRVVVTIAGRAVRVRAWRRDVKGVAEFTVPVFFLDADLEDNAVDDRRLTDSLYGGDKRYRLSQEIILGFGGVRMLRALGYGDLERFHMNEGHSSFLTLALLEEKQKETEMEEIRPEAVDSVREQCIFTTHTPVLAGHDSFQLDLVNEVLDHQAVVELQKLCCYEGDLNMTFLALNFSRYINGVAKRHGEVSRELFAPYTIDAITNGVHAATWTSSAVATLFDRHLPGWREDSLSLRYALSIPPEELWQAHREAKEELLQYVGRHTNTGMDLDVLTIGFARRMTAYKRPDLLFTEIERLRQVASTAGPLQIVFSGKAHPRDQQGKELIKRIHAMRDLLRDEIPIAFLSNYDMVVGKAITAGVDLWLNTPQPPMEASGTSGMKAALNGVPSFSILDGWWIEGCVEGVTGWAIGDQASEEGGPSSAEASKLYDKLEQVIVPMFYNNRAAFLSVMRQAIALNGSFFNTHRMIQQYGLKAYI